MDELDLSQIDRVARSAKMSSRLLQPKNLRQFPYCHYSGIIVPKM